jgi:hypothetical protein
MSRVRKRWREDEKVTVDRTARDMYQFVIAFMNRAYSISTI